VTTIDPNEPLEPIEILLVEDNPADADLMRELLTEAKVRNRLHHVGDGVEALAFLRRQGRHADAPRPDLVLLDLNLPRKDGREVLAEIKRDPDLLRIPVIVMSISKDEQDVLRCYELHANSYVPKPVDLDQFVAVVRSLEGFWLAAARLPPTAERGH
jgi:CheY-like chemotaxis protein